MSFPLVSIIIVVYNAEGVIELTLDSIFSQTYPNIETVIIDGKSTDRTLEIINKYSSRITKVISEPDSGIYDAMNKGLDYVNGEWIFFLNAGDVFVCDTTLSDVFKQDFLSDVLYGDTLLKTDKHTLSSPSHIDKLFFFGNTLCHQSVFFNRRIFFQIEKFDTRYKVLADRDLLLRAFIKKCIFTKVHATISVYDQDGFSARNQSIYRLEELSLRKKYFSFFEFLRYGLRKIKTITIDK
jgi:glycosyltransferase involved in cell wall biosynthesis